MVEKIVYYVVESYSLLFEIENNEIKSEKNIFKLMKYENKLLEIIKKIKKELKMPLESTHDELDDKNLFDTFIKDTNLILVEILEKY